MCEFPFYMAPHWSIATGRTRIDATATEAAKNANDTSGPDTARNKPTAKTGLAIAGGGPVGAIYELGALRALDESIDGLKLHDLDVYVGVSSGAMIAASLANGISTVEMCRIFTGQEYASIRFDPERLMRPAFKEYMERASMLPAV